MARTRKGKTPQASLAGATTPSAQPSFFLRTKLLPPRPAPELLPRPRLTVRLLANLSASRYARDRQRRFGKNHARRRLPANAQTTICLVSAGPY